jgi:hypothetical protein
MKENMHANIWTNNTLNFELRILISTVCAVILFYYLRIFDSVLKLILEHLLTEEVNLNIYINLYACIDNDDNNGDDDDNDDNNDDDDNSDDDDDNNSNDDDKMYV